MITKRKLGRGKVRVTFTVPPMDNVQQLNLVGDFNGSEANDACVFCLTGQQLSLCEQGSRR